MKNATALLRRLGALLGIMGLTFVGAAALLAFSTPPEPSVRPARVLADSTPVLPASLLGLSGKLRAFAATPTRMRELPLFRRLLADSAPGVHPMGMTAPDGEPVVLLSLVPFAVKRGSNVLGYHIGFWPSERAESTRSRGLPEGFIEVTPENQFTRVSKRFELRDFLTHDQQNVWPKYLVLQLPLLDKLELIGQALEQMGKPSRLQVMSGFRTPQYNALGVGRLGGRARDSRHMYGDAADIYVDVDGNGQMDDLDGDGRVTMNDARFLGSVAERVELENPTLIGGLGVYHANGVHGPFLHVDVRGYRARW